MLNMPITTVDEQTDLIDSFSRSLLVRDGLKENTRYNHMRAAQRAVDAFGTQFPTHQQVEDYVEAFYKAGYSYWYIVSTIRTLKRYMAFIGDPIELGYPKRPKPTVPDTLSQAEVAIIIAATRNIREKAIISLLAYSGIRNNELCSLRVKDIDFGRNRIHVELGKGAKSRNIPVAGECTTILLAYMAEYPRGTDSYFITSLRHNNPYDPSYVRRMVKKVVARTKIEKDVWPHLFRHSLATNLLSRGANPITIQEVLGHSFIETTMLYVHACQKRVTHEYNLYVPSYA